MSNDLEMLGESARWHLMVSAAKRGAEEAGYRLDRVPGRGLSNVWNLRRNGEVKATSIRTTRDRWIAFPPLEHGTKWKTLDDVELVLVASVDDKQNPKRVVVYLLDAVEVRQHFDAAYAARIEAGNIVRDNYGMWVGLDTKDPGPANSVGSGLVGGHKPLAVFSIASLIESGSVGEVSDLEPESDSESGQMEARCDDEPPLTIAEAKRLLARSLGVNPASIKITIEA